MYLLLFLTIKISFGNFSYFANQGFVYIGMRLLVFAIFSLYFVCFKKNIYSDCWIIKFSSPYYSTYGGEISR